MSDLDKLAQHLDDPNFAQKYEQDRVKAVEEAVGRPLTQEEKEGVKTLHHEQLKRVVQALRPRATGTMRPD